MVVAARKLDTADLCVFIAAPPLDLNSQVSTLNSQVSTLNSQVSTLNSQLSTLKSQIFHTSGRLDAGHRLRSLMI